MVTTTNKIDHLAIKRMFLTFSLLLSVFSSFSQTAITIDSLSVIERDFQFEQFKNRYFQIPSLINQSNLKKFSYGEGKYLYGEGKLRHPQEFKKQNGLYLKTASLAALENTNWTFYGSLEYLNTRIEDVENNLTYGISEYNSPYYFFQKTTGIWNHQNYNFEISAAHKVNSKLSLGGYLNYDTNFYFRKTDTRNELTALKINGKLSASYQFNEKHLLSLALSTEFFKTDSELGNKFPENNTEVTANYYLNTGLGSYIKNIDNGFQTKRILPQLQLHWLLKQNNWDLSVESATKYGVEKWVDKNIVRVEENDELTKYSFLNQQFNVVYNQYKKNSLLSINLNAEYLKGKGKVWQEVGTYYAKNFNATNYNFKTEANILFYKKFLNKVSLGVNYSNVEQLDLNYAYQFDYQFLEPKVAFGLHKDVSTKTSFFTNISGLYHHVLDMQHNPYAANNIYVDWIGNSVADYTGTSSFNLNTKLGFNVKLKNENTLECSLTGDYWKATSLSNETINYVSKSDDYLSLVVGLKLYF